MKAILRPLFWCAGLLVAWTYVLFPLVVVARARLRPRAVAASPIEPSVSIVIAARNEAAVIGAKIENLLGTDYPAERREIVVASDGSEDDTERIVAEYASAGVRCVGLPRVGKADALNSAVAASSGEILVFSDANSMFEPGALRALVAPFADSEVGGVAGDQRYLDSARTVAGGVVDGERRYWDLDRAIKRAESRGGSAVAATGAIYALRRSLFEPVLAGVTDDFFTSTGVVARGCRLVFAEDAIAYEPVAGSGTAEFGRKVRVITRGLRGVSARRDLLDPRRHGFYSLQLLSHKVLRRIVVIPLVVLLVSAPLLWTNGALYRLATVGQLAAYGAALAGLASPAPWARRKPFSLAAFFVLVNAAAARAVWNLLRGTAIDRWEPQRETGHEPDRREPAQAKTPRSVR